jgi:site-specific DNA-methyltransferase (adenine-specific)
MRFLYNAKASKADRDEGLDGFELRSSYMVENGSTGENLENNDGANRGARTTAHRNHHPTVKPTELMRYLVRLVTQPCGTVLDPFTGSGSTGKAAVLEGFEFIGIEREAEYVAIAEARIVEAQRSLGLFA